MADGKKTVAVVGGGLVGGTVACMLARRGFHVDLYENRSDIRKMAVVKGRSINLALSKRGRDALAAIGLEDHVVNTGVRMCARMIHDLDGRKRSIPYGKDGECIVSIDRRQLNEDLISAAEAEPNVDIHFQHKLVACKLETGQMTFQKDSEEIVTRHADLVLGCDGAFSSVRRQMAKSSLFNYSQEYIPHGYMELSIPAKHDGDFAMDMEYLHIWPRNDFMMIGLPNDGDRSFTGTLFMPFEIFEGLKDEKAVTQFFEKTFPDAIPLIGRDELVKTFLSSKALPMIMIKCSPYNVSDKALIMGDAAHAMVPFYGQGMNCGLEDALVFSELLDKYNNDFSKAVPEFTVTRNEDCKAICDMAMYNYVEMRHSVNSTLFLMRKKLDNFLNLLMPQTWIPLYTMVSFSRKRYSDCIREKQWQDKVLNRLSLVTLALSVGAGSMYAIKNHHTHIMTLATAAAATIGEWTKRLQLYQG